VQQTDQLRADGQQQKEHFTTIFLNRLNSFYSLESAPKLNELNNYLYSLSESKDTKLPSTWAKVFSQLLKNLGWMLESEKHFSSREMQCLNTWNECLDDLASLDLFIGKLPRHKAAKELQRITAEKLFQIKTKEQPIKVLGLLESVGMTFDHLWVMGCHSDCLPARPNPNPFIPLRVQNNKDLPHSSPKRELQFAEKTIRRLLFSSQNIIFSYPTQINDSKLQITSLLKSPSLPIIKSHFIQKYRIKDLMQPANLELWQDKPILSISPNEFQQFTNSGLSAGFKVLKNQADCPFQAFAAHRLHSDFIRAPLIDFDSRERGILIHKTLQLFWEKHKTNDALRSLNNKNLLEKEIRNFTQEAMKINSEYLRNQPRFKKMEEDRTVILLTEWMDKEMLRPPFEVQHDEKREFVVIDKLKLKIKIDRIDVTPQGDVILVDYKTGFIKPSEWFTNRTQDPQIPLYAFKLLPSGIALASIRKGDLKWISLYDKNSSIIHFGNIPRYIPKDTGWPDWKELLGFWKTQLVILAKEFMEGKLIIDPLKEGETCKNCSYQTLCRIGEVGLHYENEENINV
jgi:probable DNA repair protein